MTEADRLAERFEAHRDRLRAVAVRMLGSGHAAADAVQEAWLRLSRSDTEAVENLGGWLTTVVPRICLDVLRARAAGREVGPDAAPEPVAATTPEEEIQLADSVGAALLVVLDTLAPHERLAFVLHDMFAVPFEEIAPIVGRSPIAAQSWPAEPGGACGQIHGSPTPHRPPGARSLRRPCRRPGRATSPRRYARWTARSCCTPTPRRSRWPQAERAPARPSSARRCAGPTRSPGSSPAAPTPPVSP